MYRIATDTVPTAYTTEGINPTSTSVTVSAPIEPGAWYRIGNETILVSHYNDRHNHAGIIRAFARSDAQAHPSGTPLYRQRLTQN